MACRETPRSAACPRNEASFLTGHECGPVRPADELSRLASVPVGKSMSTTPPRPSVLRRIRHRIGPAIDRLARRVGQPEYHVRDEGYAGTVGVPLADLESRLSDAGFTWDPVSLYHRTKAGTDTDGSWVYRSSPLADRQLHVVLFAQSADRMDVYAHEEYNWLRHPVKHARQEDIRRERGSTEMRRWLDEQPFDYEHELRARRRLAHVAERVRQAASRVTG